MKATLQRINNQRKGYNWEVRCETDISQVFRTKRAAKSYQSIRNKSVDFLTAIRNYANS